MSTLWSIIKKNNEISHIDLRISNNYFTYFFIILSSFTASCYSIHIFLLASFPFSQLNLSLFTGVLTSTWALDTLSLQRNICQKYAHIRFHCLSQNPPHLTILEGNAQAKLLGLEFQISQILCKSTKSVRIGARILVANSFLWNSFTYMYMY